MKFNYKKIIKTIGFILLLIVIFYFSIGLGLDIRTRMEQKPIKDLAEALERYEKESYEEKMNDTYGGKTPKETLDMYIDAVEKGDYELASKYFVLEKQEEELKEFDGAKKQDIDEMLILLKRAQGNFTVIKDQYYDWESNAQIEYVYTQEVPTEIKSKLTGETFISPPGEYTNRATFIKYPNGIWKLLKM